MYRKDGMAVKVYGIIRITAGKLLAAVTATVCLLLGWDAWNTAHTEPEVKLVTVYDRALYLKEKGLPVSPEPVWIKEIFFADPPGEDTEPYLAMLEAQGYTPREHLGRTLTMTCFRALGEETLYARIITDGNLLVGADKFFAYPEAEGYLPL